MPPLTPNPITNFSGGPCGGNLTTILARSCNTPFAKLAAETLGPLVMVNQAEAAGFNTDVPFDLPGSAVSNYPTDYGKRIQSPTPERPAGLYENTPKLAQTAIGQNDVQASPLMMALVAAGVANDGVIAKPHVLAEVRDDRSLLRLAGLAAAQGQYAQKRCHKIGHCGGLCSKHQIQGVLDADSGIDLKQVRCGLNIPRQ